ncbi:hypothetical protein ACSLBF_16200 [Pseudoalteromonas sp. T1lg65]|uniref:hypothetical protein n=1 Tax=Pseudoalteromonas sp. T1lg65 TaxID=2077101 RepID=UPI003F795DFD
MVTKYKARIALVSASLLMTAGVLSFNDSEQNVTVKNETCACNELSSSYEQCQPEAHTSWAAWLTGGSSSGQFHYLDLLELLVGSNDEQSRSDTPSPL